MEPSQWTDRPDELSILILSVAELQLGVSQWPRRSAYRYLVLCSSVAGASIQRTPAQLRAGVYPWSFRDVASRQFGLPVEISGSHSSMSSVTAYSPRVLLKLQPRDSHDFAHAFGPGVQVTQRRKMRRSVCVSSSQHTAVNGGHA